MPPLVLDGTNGVSGVDGTASNPAIEGTDSNTGIFYPAADTVAIGTGGTEALRVDSARNMGLGVTPSAWGGGYKGFDIAGNGAINTANSLFNITANAYWNGTNWIYSSTDYASRMRQYQGTFAWYTAASGTAGNAITFTQAMTLTASGQLELTAATPRLAIAPSTGTNNAFVHFINSSSANFSYVGIDSNGGGLGGQYTMNLWHGANYAMVFATNNIERARITSDGKLLVGITTTLGGLLDVYQTSNAKVAALRSTSASQTNPLLEVLADRNTTNNTYYAIQTGVANVGYRFQVADSGNVTNTNSSYGAISDIKLKQDIVDAGSQWSDIKNLRFRKFRWKSEVIDNQNAPAYLGVIAQEAEEISPSLIEEHIDRDSEGNDIGTVTKSVKYSILYMKAVKALQEAMTRIEALEAEVQVLKGNA